MNPRQAVFFYYQLKMKVHFWSVYVAYLIKESFESTHFLSFLYSFSTLLFQLKKCKKNPVRRSETNWKAMYAYIQTALLCNSYVFSNSTISQNLHASGSQPLLRWLNFFPCHHNWHVLTKKQYSCRNFDCFWLAIFTVLKIQKG